MAAETKNTKAFYNTEIPSDWEVKELGKIAFVNMGQSPDSENYNEIEEGLPLIQGNADIRNRKSFKRYFTTQLTKLCDEGDLILSVRAPVGSIGEASFKSCIGRGVCAIKPNKVNKEYLYQLLLNSEDKWKKIEQGSTFTAVSSDDVRKFKLLVPKNEAEQKAIAQVLRTADATIHTTEKIIAQKVLRKNWFMQQLLTGKKRLKGFEGEWKEVPLSEMFSERNETKYFDLPLLSIGQNGVYPQDESIKKDTSNDDKSKYKRICPGDIGYNTMRMWQGRSALSGLEGIVSPAYTVVTPKKNTDSLFFSYLFKMPKMTNLFWRNSQGLVDDTLNCKFKDFSIVRVVLPQTKEEQTAIAQVLQAADKEISLLKAKAEKLREQKKGLMQQLLTGKVRLKIK